MQTRPGLILVRSLEQPAFTQFDRRPLFIPGPVCIDTEKQQLDPLLAEDLHKLDGILRRQVEIYLAQLGAHLYRTDAHAVNRDAQLLWLVFVRLAQPARKFPLERELSWTTTRRAATICITRRLLAFRAVAIPLGQKR